MKYKKENNMSLENDVQEIINCLQRADQLFERINELSHEVHEDELLYELSSEAEQLNFNALEAVKEFQKEI